MSLAYKVFLFISFCLIGGMPTLSLGDKSGRIFITLVSAKKKDETVSIIGCNATYLMLHKF